MISSGRRCRVIGHALRTVLLALNWLLDPPLVVGPGFPAASDTYGGRQSAGGNPKHAT